MIKRKKVSVIGAGHVGEVTAYLVASREIADVLLVDIIEDMPVGKALDMAESRGVDGFDAEIKGTNSMDDIADSDVVVVTAGVARKPGMSREDLLKTNAKIIKSVAEKIRDIAPESIVIMVTNPLDVMTYLLWKVTGFDEKKVMGQAGILDSARFSYFIAKELDVSTEDIFAMVLGGHGDSMVPLPRYTTVSGIPLPELLAKEKIDALIERTRKGGGEIVKLLKTGSAYYAPAAAVTQMVESILLDKKRILPCSAKLNGEYDIDDVYIGVPAKLGKNGIEQVIELKLTDEELNALKKSVDIYKQHIQLALKETGIK